MVSVREETVGKLTTYGQLQIVDSSTRIFLLKKFVSILTKDYFLYLFFQWKCRHPYLFTNEPEILFNDLNKVNEVRRERSVEVQNISCRWILLFQLVVWERFIAICMECKCKKCRDTEYLIVSYFPQHQTWADVKISGEIEWRCGEMVMETREGA